MKRWIQAVALAVAGVLGAAMLVSLFVWMFDTLGDVCFSAAIGFAVIVVAAHRLLVWQDRERS